MIKKKSLITTAIRPFFWVNSQMTMKVNATDKRLPTFTAHTGPFFCVKSLMLMETSATCQRCPPFTKLKNTLSSVNSSVMTKGIICFFHINRTHTGFSAE